MRWLKEHREQLAARWAGRPFLQLLVLDLKWLAVLVSLVVLPLGAAIVLTKMWATTPRGFKPVIRISLLDMVQARVLWKKARTATAGGEWKQAALAWGTACANQPGKLEIPRDYFRVLTQLDSAPPVFLAAGPARAMWLLRLSGTNRADLELVADVFLKHRMPQFVVHCLTPLGTNLNPRLETAYLEALFLTGYRSAAVEWLNRIEAARRKTPGLRLLWAAWQAGWGTAAEQAAGEQALAAAEQAPEHKDLARALRFHVGMQRNDPEGCARALTSLAADGADSLLLHIDYWRLLVAKRRQSEALNLAAGSVCGPHLADEAMALAEFYDSLGDAEKGCRVMQRYFRDFGVVPVFTLDLGRRLMERNAWTDLHSLANEVRLASTYYEGDLELCAWFLEAMANHGERRLAERDRVLVRLQDYYPQDPTVGVQVARAMVRTGLRAQAKPLMMKVMLEVPSDAGFWSDLYTTAYATDDPALMLQAAAKAHTLSPDEDAVTNDYAAALLANRSDPEKALQLTFMILRRLPNLLPARVNHALALVQCRRADEAQAVLRELDQLSLGGAEQTSVDLAWVELHLQRGEPARALTRAASLDRRALLSAERRWLETQLAALQ